MMFLVYNPTLHFFHAKDLQGGAACIPNHFTLSSLSCFPTLCWSGVLSSGYNFSVFSLLFANCKSMLEQKFATYHRAEKSAFTGFLSRYMQHGPGICSSTESTWVDKASFPVSMHSDLVLNSAILEENGVTNESTVIK